MKKFIRHNPFPVFMRRLLFTILFILSVFVISSCSSGSSNPQNVPTTAPSQEVEAPSQPSTASESPKIMTDEVQIIQMTAKQWEFDPAPIVVKKNIPVQLEVESIDVTHGFSLSEFDISCEPSNCNIKPGETTVVRFTPDRTGIFTFRCSVFCGSGHSHMTGQLVVE